jgi:hypothetical protein
MKRYISQEEGVWKEILNPTITEEQHLILNGEDQNSKLELIQSIRSSSIQDVVDATELITLYNTYKPTLKNTDVYKLIDVNIFDNNGLINCRVNEEHLQIRF